MTILIGILAVAAVATVADYAWYTFGVRHTIVAGVIHGAAVLTAVGGVLGAASGKAWRGLPVGTLAGIAGAASYYALVAVLDRRTYGSAIPAAWILTWLYLAALEGRWLRASHPRPWTEVASRGAVAAITGGLAFYLVMRMLWGQPPAGGRNYLTQFLCWAFAWAPGLLALTIGGRRSTGVAVARSEVSTRIGVSEAADHPVMAQGAVTPEDLAARIDRGETIHILDVRFEGEFSAGHVPGALNIPFMQVSGRMSEVPGRAAEELIVYCGHGPRAYVAATALRRGGRSNIVLMTGHWAAWQAAGLRVER